jgi:transcriptional regulator of nitric oxide reductase
MARNTGSGYRRGAVTGRTQFQRPDGLWQKRDEQTGRVMEVKNDGTPFKGVAKEPDGRDTSNA